MKSKEEDEEERGSAPRWMVTYGDMMTLLLTFFVMLLTYSAIDIVKFEEAISSLQGTLGIMRKSGKEVMNFPNRMIGNRQKQQMETTTRRLKKLIEQERLEHAVSVGQTDKGLLIRISSPMLFDLGQADIKPDIRPFLDKLVGIVVRWESPVRVEGHTDDLPIRTAQFPSNWELSTARAVNVLRYLIEKGGTDPKNLSAVGYGEYHPFVPNLSAENRSRNRRVEIHLEYVEAVPPSIAEHAAPGKNDAVEIQTLEETLDALAEPGSD